MLVLLLCDKLLSLEECLSVLVELKSSDLDVRGGDGDLGLLAYYAKLIRGDEESYR